MTDEPTITINGTELSIGQAMTVRVAITTFQFELQDRKFMESLGPIGPQYQLRLNEIVELMLKERS